MRGAFHFPVSSEGKTIGVLAFNSRKIREPDERLLRAVRAIGSQIGQFLQRKEADEKVRSQALQQRLIAEFGQQALASADLAEVLERRRATRRRHAESRLLATCLQLHPDGKQLTYKAAVGWPQEWVGHRVVPVGPGQPARTRPDARRAADYRGLHRGDRNLRPRRCCAYGIRSGVQVPILRHPGGVSASSSVHTAAAAALHRRKT